MPKSYTYRPDNFRKNQLSLNSLLYIFFYIPKTVLVVVLTFQFSVSSLKIRQKIMFLLHIYLCLTAMISFVKID